MDKKARLMQSLGTDSDDMISKEEAVRICKQHGLSPHDAKREFEKFDIDHDGKIPRNIAGRMVDNLADKLK